jgi:hypothetical protein
VSARVLRLSGLSRQGGARRLRHQAGQALFLALGLLLAGSATLITLYNVGQVAAAKQRLTDTADAAAWSAGLWRARILNYHAYANRAILANEVAVAQAVTLVSWARYFESLTLNASQAAHLFPTLEPVLTTAAQAAALARQSAEVAAQMDIVARAAQGVGYKEILQTSQDILHLASQGFALNMVTAEVARANDPAHFAWVLPDPAMTWQGFTRRADADGRQRFADLVTASLDRFVAGPRDEDIHTPIPSLCLNLMRVRKTGATVLSADLQTWQAEDTASFHLRTLSWSGCREREALPLGWGAAQAGTATDPELGASGALTAGRNPRAAQLAAASGFSEPGYAGIARVRELDYDALANTLFPTAGLAVVARQSAPSVPTAAQRGLASGRILPSDSFVGGQSGHLWALSAAEVYFRRPADASPRLEYASLFNPYWQVRLTVPSAAQRVAAHAAVGVAP